MNVTDRLYTEWAWRTKSGVPDINNPVDKDILDNLIKELSEDNSQNITDIIIDLVNANKDNTKLLQRVYRTLQASPYITDLKDKLTSAGLAKDLFDNRNLFDEVITILQKGGESSIEALLKFQENSNIPSSGNIFSAAPGIPKEKIKRLANLTGAKESVTMGKGEVIFPLLYSDISLKTDGAGDLQRGSDTVELKAIGVSRQGKESGGGRFGVNRSFENYKPISNEVKPGFLNSILSDISQATSENIDEVYKNVNSYIDKIYPYNSQEVNETNTNKLALILKKAAVESYIKLKKIQEFLLFNPISGDFMLISPASDILNRLEAGEVNLTTATSPQLIGFGKT